MNRSKKIAYYRKFSRVQINRERIFAPLIHKAIRKQYSDFIEQLKKGNSSTDNISGFDLVPIIQRLWYDSAITFGAQINSMIKAERKLKRNPLGFSQRIVDLINAYYQIDILNICQGITDTTKENIIQVLQDAVSNQLSFSQMVDILEREDLTRMRARRIARTETVTAANKGALVVANDSGLVFQKEWLAAFDERTRHDHSRANGQRVEMNEFFIVGGYKMDAPGDRGGNGREKVPAKEIVNCRCTVLVEPVRDKNGNLIERGSFAFA